MLSHSDPPAHYISATILRGGIRESVHSIAFAAIDGTGTLIGSAGGSELTTTMRSAAKPLQAIPLVTLPAAADLALSDEELAICCASHAGQPRHTALAASVLALSGFLPDDLVCGRAALPSSPLKHGCSGNHAGILLTAHLLGAPLEGYHLADHPAQQAILREIERLAGADSVPISADGCGIPTYGLTLRQMALAFARLAEPGSRWHRIPHAMAAYPELIGSPDWIDVRVMRATGSRIIAKTGAEGLLCLAEREPLRGMAIKVLDGSTRALGPAALALLERLGWLRPPETELLEDLREPVLSDTLGRPAASIRIELPADLAP